MISGSDVVGNTGRKDYLGAVLYTGFYNGMCWDQGLPSVNGEMPCMENIATKKCVFIRNSIKSDSPICFHRKTMFDSDSGTAGI